MSILPKLTLLLIAFLSSACKEPTVTRRITFAGDLMFDRGLKTVSETNELSHFFDDIKPYLSPTTVANFESTCFNDTVPALEKAYVFKTDTSVLSVLKQNGICYLNLANNHSFDYGYKGLAKTISAINNARCTALGICDTNQKINPTTISLSKKSIVIFCNSSLRSNCNRISQLDDKALTQAVTDYKRTHPNTFALCYLHWGIEGNLQPSTVQINLAHALIEAGADLIVGHHPHCVQTIEKYKSKVIVYSLGNFVFDNSTAPFNKGLLLDIVENTDGNIAVQLLPYYLIRFKPKPLSRAENEIYIKEIQQRSVGIQLKNNYPYWTIE